MGRTTIQDATKYEERVALKLMQAIFQKIGIPTNHVYSMYNAGATIDATVHYILKELENGK